MRGLEGGGDGHFASKEMALHRVHAAYLLVNLRRPKSTQTAYGGRPVRPRRIGPTHVHEHAHSHTFR